MRRLTILLAAVGALLLIPAAQAFAEEEAHVNIAGTGSGTVTSESKAIEELETEFGEPVAGRGTPPIECTSPPPGEGVCDNVMEEEAGIFYDVLEAVAGPGSEFAGWTVEAGNPYGNEFFLAFPEECEAGTVCILYEEGFEDVEVTATFTAATPKLPLTLKKEGTGEGTVVSSPAGIECSTACTEETDEFEEGSLVTLTASPGANSAFTSWKGCETVEGRKCKVTMSAAKEVKAKFSSTYNVTVKKTAGATGLGGISGVTCDASCSSATASFLVGKAATLKPKASKGSAFTEWSSCPGEIVESVNCKMTSAGTAEAKFTAIPKFSLTVSKTGGGQGTVKSKPSSINCGLTCSTQTSSFQEGTEVELTASVTAGKGSSFGGWIGGSGTCTGETTPCKMPAIVGTQSITAEFK